MGMPSSSSSNPTAMDNHGKLWTIDQDQKLMESPQLSNSYLSHIMGRSENAIKCRRSHIAAKMHLDDPGTSLEEYVGLMNGDMTHATALIQEWNDKRASLRNFVDRNRKRRQEEMTNPMASPPPKPKQTTSRFFAQDAPPQAPPAPKWVDMSGYQQIEFICQSIREEHGNLASLFNDPQFLPLLIQHYRGFEAYARVVQARLSSSSSS